MYESDSEISYTCLWIYPFYIVEYSLQRQKEFPQTKMKENSLVKNWEVVEYIECTV